MTTKTENKEEVQTLLVNSANGIYAFHTLATNYDLYSQEGIQYNKEVMIRDFNPDNEDYCDNVCYIEQDLYVKEEGKLYRVESIEGDIWAINPAAEYCCEFDSYKWKEINGKERYVYRLPEWSICAIVNGDFTGIDSEEDCKLVKEFMHDELQDSIIGEIEEYGSFYDINDMTSLGDNCVNVEIYR